MFKTIFILVISVMDSTMTIDSHNWHFVYDYCLQAAKCINVAHNCKDNADILLNIIDCLI